MEYRSKEAVPIAPDAEKAVLGIILIEQAIPADVALDKSLFYAQSNREIFQAIQEVDADNSAIDPIQVIEKLRQMGRLESIGVPYITGLTDGAIRSNFHSAVDLLTKMSAKREIWRVTSRAAEESLNGRAPGEILAELRTSLDRVSTEGKASKRWPKPLPLPGGRIGAPKLSANILPPALRPWLEDIALRLQVPLDFAAIPAIVSLATVIGSKVRIRPKQKDDWTVVLNLWGAVVGDPGLLKSPSIEQATKPLRRLIAQAESTHLTLKKQFAIDDEIDTERRKDVQRRVKAAIASGEDPAPLMAEMGEPLPEPTEKRYIVNDATVEKLGELLAENLNGLLMFRDELTGWLRTLDRETNANERAFYLESWNGGQPYVYDRIGRGTTRIPNTTMSVIGGIQPGPLAEYLAAANATGAGADGLMQRFQLSVWPDDPGEYVHIDQWPDNEAKNAAFKTYQELDLLSISDGRFTLIEDSYAYLRFDREAQPLFDDWYTDIQNRIRSRTTDPAFRSHLAKFGSLFASLALIFHLCETADLSGEIPPVSKSAVVLAIHWCDYLEGHARKIYGLQVAEAGEAVKRLAAKIRSGDLENGFQVRHIQRKNWAGLTKAEDVYSALAVLGDLRWVEQVEVPSLVKTSRPKIQFLINPQIQNIS